MQQQTLTIDADGARDGIFFVSPKSVFPDPDQPRVDADEDLQASIEELGVQVPIMVRPHPEHADAWMIVDGERRWRGAYGAGASEIPIAIRLDLEDRADRLLIQLVANTGKPLTPLEQGRAWRELMNLKGWSQQDLADATGVARSTIGDYVRMTELPAPWLELLVKEKLQASHVPHLHKFRALPEEIHKEARKKLLDSWQWRDATDGGGQMEVEEFAYEVPSIYRGFVLALSDVDPAAGYDGPVFELKMPGDQKARKYIADVDPDKLNALQKKAEPVKATTRDAEPESDWQRQSREATRKRNAELKRKTAQRQVQFATVAAQLPAELNGDWWLFVVRGLLGEMHNDGRRSACKALGLEGKKGQHGSWDFETPILKHAESLPVADRGRLLVQLLLAPELAVNLYYTGDAKRLKAAAGLLGVDLSKVKASDPVPANPLAAKPAPPAGSPERVTIRSANVTSAAHDAYYVWLEDGRTVILSRKVRSLVMEMYGWKSVADVEQGLQGRVAIIALKAKATGYATITALELLPPMSADVADSLERAALRGRRAQKAVDEAVAVGS